MKLTGHTEDQSNLSLSELVIELTATEARKIAVFLNQTAHRMDSMGLEYDHEHLSDHVKEFELSPELVIVGGKWHSDNIKKNNENDT